jgi:hypothetical protein
MSFRAPSFERSFSLLLGHVPKMVLRELAGEH